MGRRHGLSRGAILILCGGVVGCAPPGDAVAVVPPAHRGDDEGPAASAASDLAEVFGGHSELYADARGEGLVHTFTFEEASRQVRLHFPEGWNPQQPAPVRALFHFHSCGGRTVENDYYDSFHRPENGGFLVVTLGAAARCWEIDPLLADVPYAIAVIEGLESLSWVDAGRRRLGGMSGGDFMAEVVGCRFGADVIVVGAGGIAFPPEAPTVTPTPAPDPSTCVSHPDVFKHHGATDPLVPIRLGREARDFWAKVNACTIDVDDGGQPVSLSSEDEPAWWCRGGLRGEGPSNEERIVPPEPCACFAYECAQGSLTYCEDGGGHVWYPQHKQVGADRFGDDAAASSDDSARP